MTWMDPCLLRSRTAVGDLVVRLGVPQLDAYLEFLVARPASDVRLPMRERARARPAVPVHRGPPGRAGRAHRLGGGDAASGSPRSVQRGSSRRCTSPSTLSRPTRPVQAVVVYDMP